MATLGDLMSVAVVIEIGARLKETLDGFTVAAVIVGVAWGFLRD